MKAKGKPMTLLFGAFGLALAAGVSGGLLLARLPNAPTDGPAGVTPVSPLTAELGLSPPQAEQMRKIWEGVRDTAQSCLEDARRLQKQRDDALVSLLSDEQKEKFQNISQEYADSFAELNRKRDQEFQKAVGQTRKLLNEEQWRKYERILKNRVGPGAIRGLAAGDMTQPSDPVLAP